MGEADEREAGAPPEASPIASHPATGTVRRSEIAAAGRMDAGYWLAPPVVRAYMDQGMTRGAADTLAAQERAAQDAEDDVVRFLLDGLGVESLAELRLLVCLVGVLGVKLDRVTGYGRRGDWEGLREYVLLNLLSEG